MLNPPFRVLCSVYTSSTKAGAYELDVPTDPDSTIFLITKYRTTPIKMFAKAHRTMIAHAGIARPPVN